VASTYVFMFPLLAALFSEAKDSHMLGIIAIGAGLTGSNVIIHAVGTTMILQWLPKLSRHWMARWQGFGSMAVLLACSSWILFLHTLEVVVWALAYLWLTPIKEIPNFSTALYFSGSTYTTVGYGDIILEAPWRLLTSFEAMAGMLLLGWSTALLFAIMRDIRHKMGHDTQTLDEV